MDGFELNEILGAIFGQLHRPAQRAACSQRDLCPGQADQAGIQDRRQEEPTANAPAAKTEEAPPIEARLASADVNRGKSETKVCMTCHTLEKDGPNKVGPNLWGVVDRPRASHPGFDYSAAMKAKGGKWTFDELDKFLTHPQGYIAGTKMTFNGIQNAKQRGDLIAYLRTQSDNPVPLPAAPAAAGNEQKPPQQTSGSEQKPPAQTTGSAPNSQPQNNAPNAQPQNSSGAPQQQNPPARRIHRSRVLRKTARAAASAA